MDAALKLFYLHKNIGGLEGGFAGPPILIEWKYILEEVYFTKFFFNYHATMWHAKAFLTDSVSFKTDA